MEQNPPGRFERDLQDAMKTAAMFGRPRSIVTWSNQCTAWKVWLWANKSSAALARAFPTQQTPTPEAVFHTRVERILGA